MTPNTGRAGRKDAPPPVGAEIAALEERAERLMRSAATLTFEAMRCIAQAQRLYAVRNGETPAEGATGVREG